MKQYRFEQREQKKQTGQRAEFARNERETSFMICPLRLTGVLFQIFWKPRSVYPRLSVSKQLLSAWLTLLPDRQTRK